MNPKILKAENMKRNTVIRKMLRDQIRSLGRCAFVDCGDCALLLKYPLHPGYTICLLVNL